MKRSKLLGLLSISLGCASFSQAAFIVTPPANATTLGGFQSGSPLRGKTASGGAHNQQVQTSALFATAGGPISITSLSFRPTSLAPSFLFGNSITTSNVRITLSTTARGDEAGVPLSSTFASNLGSDARLVYSGALTLTTKSTGTPTGDPTKDFDLTVNLQSPFTYDPSKGNLLFDFVIPDGSSVTTNGALGFVNFDTVNNFNDGVYSVFDQNSGSSLSGTADTSGVPVLFGYSPVSVPEPTALGGAAMAAMMLARRSRRA